MQQLTRNILIIALILSLGFNVYLFSVLFMLKINQGEIGKSLKGFETNEKKVAFAKLFVEKVFLGKGDVSFEDRLLMENAVREINNKEILNQWQRFVDSNSENAQSEASALLIMLLAK